jgi:hypothetical protein
VKRGGLSLFAVVCAVLLAGCGGGAHFTNFHRPPTPINLTASVNDRAVSVSPANFGAGPVTLYASNIAGQTETLTIVRLSTEKAVGTTGPINPGTPATVSMDLAPGQYTIVASGTTASAELYVGKSRPSADNTLLQP